MYVIGVRVPEWSSTPKQVGLLQAKCLISKPVSSST